jgi:alpha-D-ribose 1-methylphosphonate 5-triphosphate synthase subunit PhnG
MGERRGMSLTLDMDERFRALEADLQELIDLLNVANDTFWLRFMRQGLVQVKARRLSGATYVLGCYGGAETFSDLELPGSGAATNQRLIELRNEIYALANAIAAASAQPRARH